MRVNLKKRISFPCASRHPLIVFGQISIIVLLLMSAFWGLLALFMPDNIVLTVNALVWGMITLAATGMRFVPLTGGILGSLALYVLATRGSFSFDYQAHPGDAYGLSSNPWLAYLFLIVFIILFWGMILTYISRITAKARNSITQKRHSSPWFGLVMIGLVVLLLGALFIGALILVPASATAMATVTH